MKQMNRLSKRENKAAQELVAYLFAFIPKIIGMPKMEFCRLVGEALGKSKETIYDYMLREYIPREYTSKNLIAAIDSAISMYVPHVEKKLTAEKSTKNELTKEQSEEKESVKKRWKECKRYFSFSAHFLDVNNLSDFINKLELNENLPRVFITQFLNADLSNIKFESDEKNREFLAYLQSCIKKVPRIEDFLYSKEEAATYMRMAKEIGDIPELKPIHIQIEEGP